ncbi:MULTISPECIES: Hsp20/alpha crystallin family protein [unclassified Streptomyces]|uniref:Hsp20/alpha crystallin family protein n=1 Tax=unclassified Streptomyces TaxID=2593676 RepID=UPI0035D67E86
MTGNKVERRRRLFPDFDDMFNREFPGLPGWRPATAAHSIPMEMTTGDGAYVLRAELPGMDPDDITLTAADDLLTVRAEHSESREDKEHSEFRYGSFRRTVRLPATIPADDVEASYADGILTVRVPMPDAAGEAARTIPVKRADGRATS